MERKIRFQTGPHKMGDCFPSKKEWKNGCLGIGCILKKNVALLGRCFRNEQESVWATVIRSKYGLSKDGWNSRYLFRSTQRSPWKGISLISPLLQSFIKYSLGNGATSRFELDSWATLIFFSTLFPSFYILSLKKLSVVSNFYMSSDWTLHLKRNITNDEVSQVSSHLHIYPPSSFLFSFRLLALSLAPSGSFPISSFFLGLSSPSVCFPFKINMYSLVP